jgi:hypothetical protein
MDEERIDEGISFVASYAKGVTDWATLKKELLKFFAPQERKLFSTRDPITKAQRMNEFEEEIARKWTKLTGFHVIITNHDEKRRKAVT